MWSIRGPWLLSNTDEHQPSHSAHSTLETKILLMFKYLVRTVRIYGGCESETPRAYASHRFHAPSRISGARHSTLMHLRSMLKSVCWHLALNEGTSRHEVRTICAVLTATTRVDLAFNKKRSREAYHQPAVSCWGDATLDGGRTADRTRISPQTFDYCMWHAGLPQGACQLCSALAPCCPALEAQA